MFDFVHNNKRAVQVFMALIILPFAFWGIDSYTRSASKTDTVATVNDSKITQQEFDTALRQQQERLRQMLGKSFDPSMLENPEMKRAALDNLIAQRLLLERAQSSGLVVSDEQMAQVIQSIEPFQENGRFDKKRYETALAGQQMSPAMFEARLHDELMGQQVRDVYAQNGFAPSSTVDSIIRLNEQQRLVSVATIAFQPFVAQAKVNDAAIKDYYEKNSKDFQVPEQARVEYVKLSADGLLSKTEVSIDEAHKYYEAHQSELGAPEERQAAHILISVAAGMPQAEQDAAKAKAEQLLQQVKQNPGKFAELARQNSQDPGSAANGGDLGFFRRGMMVKPFEDATFALNQGEVSGLVKSDFGYHIIKLLAVKASKAAPFEVAREGILNKLRQQKAADTFAELAEKFSNIVYEQSDTLTPAADLIGAKVEQSAWLSKGMVASEPWNAAMLQAVFSDDVIKNKRNTAAVEVAGNTLVAARMLEHRPAAVRSLSEVQGVIREKLVRQQAVDLAVQQGKAALKQLQHGDKPALSWGAAQSVTRAQHGALDAALVRQVFQANAAKLPQYVGAETADVGYVLIRIDAVKDGDKAEHSKQVRYAQQLRQVTGEEMFQAYLNGVRQKANIEFRLPEPKTAQP